MLISVNEQRLAADFSHLANLEEVLAEIHAHHVPPGQELYQVHLNGRFFSERYPRESRYLAIDEIDRLEVKTITQVEMARVLLKEAVAQADTLSQAIVACARLFRVAPEEEANRWLAQVLEALRWLFQTGAGGLRVLSPGGPEEPPHPEALSGLLQNLEKLLTEMETIAAEEDYIMLADLLEYELVPLVQAWRRLITALVQS
jgi:hypothetical protein